MDNLIIDIDGTLLNGTQELNHAADFLNHFENTGKNYLLATNSIKSHQDQVERFKIIGLSILPEKIYTPIDSINQKILREKISNLMIIGSENEIRQINANHTFQNPELIVLLDFEKINTTYNDLQKIINNIENGSSIISASGSPFYLKNGKKQIDTGAFVHLIESITNQKVEILGKPSSDYFLGAQSVLGKDRDSITVIGDDWKTDIKGAKNVGFHSILIKSGKYVEGDEDKGKPDSVIDNFLELLP